MGRAFSPPTNVDCEYFGSPFNSTCFTRRTNSRKNERLAPFWLSAGLDRDVRRVQTLGALNRCDRREIRKDCQILTRLGLQTGTTERTSLPLKMLVPLTTTSLVAVRMNWRTGVTQRIISSTAVAI